MRFKSTLLAAALMLAPIGFAHAVPITVDFTATGFGASAPQSSVAGTLVYEAASLGATTISSITSLNLTIAGHSYTLGEVGSLPWGANLFIGGTACAVNCITHGTNDFWFQWNPLTKTGVNFAYSAPGSSFHNTSTFSSFSAAVRVPEPMSLGSMGAGLLAMWGLRRRRSAS
jgi:hypothetical protein